MEKSGFIERVRDSKDERCVNIRMTEYADRIMKEVTEKISKNIIPALNKIEEDKKTELLRA